MNIIVKIGDSTYANLLSATVTSSIENLCNEFSFATSPGINAKIPIRIGDSCEVYADKELVLTGFIEAIRGSGSNTSQRLMVQGRDLTCDLADSHIDVINSFTGLVTLKKVIESILEHIELDIEVIDLTSETLSSTDSSSVTSIDFGEKGTVSPEPGDNCFKYVDKLARSKSVLLTSNQDGNIEIYRSTFTADPNRYTITNQAIDTGANNVLSYNFNYDDTKRFYSYAASGSSNISDFSVFQTGQSFTAAVDQKGFALDPGGRTFIRQSRRFVIVNENSGEANNATLRADWERNIRLARSRTYGCKLIGFRDKDNNLWSTNSLVRVFDEPANIDEILLINRVKFSYGSEGATTDLELVDRDSYKLASQEEGFRSKKTSGNFGNVFNTYDNKTEDDERPTKEKVQDLIDKLKESGDVLG